jgi:DNA repair ATPase RecN
MHLENENNRLQRLGQDYSHATVAKLSAKYTKALQEIQHWKESCESYQRQAAKLRAELDELHNELGNQRTLKPISLEDIKVYKLHGHEVIRVEDLRRLLEQQQLPLSF